jgi:hypothetical protein
MKSQVYWIWVKSNGSWRLYTDGFANCGQDLIDRNRNRIEREYGSNCKIRAFRSRSLPWSTK